MSTFVLVHGAMHGGWCWRGVRTHLVANGHVVHTPTLTGQGDRRHLLTPDVGIDTHVTDLLEMLWFEDLRDVILGLHSYAGVLAGPVVEQAESRVAAVAYLGAFLTRSGESLLDVEPDATAARYRELAATGGDGWRVPASSAFLAQWGVTDANDSEWVGPRLTDFPLRCCTEPTVFDDAVLTALPRSYVRHTAPPLPSLELSAQRAEADGASMYELACGHDLMIERPSETADLLQRISRGSPAQTDVSR